MQITQTFYAKNRAAWRQWLKKNHKAQKEIWLVYYKKDSGKQRLSYSDAVEEALCFGWIDSTMKPVDEISFAQRFTPRKDPANWSHLNMERAKRMIEQGLMTTAGIEKLGDALTYDHKTKKAAHHAFTLAAGLKKALQSDKQTWRNFQKFPEHYKRIRIGWLENSRHRPEFFKKRLAYFLKMTKQNKRYGTMQ